jgi:hypothetical protein
MARAHYAFRNSRAVKWGPASGATPSLFSIERLSGINLAQLSAAKAMIINLNKYRKQRERAEAEQRAAENRVRFGRSKAVRTKDLRERQRAEKSIDDKRLGERDPEK